ncbi:MAG: bifunctional homocysteine S-methyltransferase/methylenetetrahydrofolate reductase [Oscillospiraceae bacterium]
MNIRDYIQNNILLFDGAMGTYFAAHNNPDTPCERANLENPEAVEAIHRAYLDAGARAIKTNTFGANRLTFGGECAAILRAGYELACRAAGDDAFVFADIGPVDSADGRTADAEYLFIADTFLACGAKHFLFETNSSDRGLHAAAAHIKAREPDAFILLSFAAQPDGFTSDGELYSDLIRAAAADPNVDAVGLNCVSGARHTAELVKRLGSAGTPLSAMPNAGYPTVRGRRTYYDGDPQYFAGQLRVLRELGVGILGGCCGTTPEHIAAAAGALRALSPVSPAPVSPETGADGAKPERNPFWEKLCDPRQKPFAVELDSPPNADLTKFMAGAEELRGAGADIITIADCPIARARMDSSLLACKLRRELQIDALPHMTCRDRNQNATQALLLGLNAEGIRNVLLITGDPIPSAQRDEVKSVYNFNSRKLIKYVSNLNASVLPTPFQVFGALNVNVRNFRIQLELAQQKEENGAVGFLTQPVLTQQALENLKLARETLHGKILGGIIPVVSQKNALFMNSEIAGITVDEKIIAAYEGADRARGEELAIDISAAVAKAIAPYVDGYYLMTPFGRTNLIARIMQRIREDGLA